MKVTSILAVLAFTATTYAEAEPRIRSYKSLCGYPGMACAKTKRAAEAVAEALANAEPRIRSYKSLCGYPGMACAKARRSLGAIEDSLHTTVDGVFQRDADPEAEARIRSYKSLCGYPGMACARSAEPRIRSYKSLCGYPGMACAKMKRGLELVKEDDPEIFKDECFAQGGECHAVLAAQEAFHEAVKREAEAEAAKPWDTKSWRFARDINSGKVDLKAAQAECNAPGGDCAAAQAQLDELEATLAKAVTDVYKID